MKPKLKGVAEKGLPRVNYVPPVLGTLSATVLLLFVLGLLTIITGFAAVTQFGKVTNNEAQGSVLTLGVCGLGSLLCLGATVYFAWTVIKGVRDLFTPLYYTRGIVADKRIIGGRNTGTWLGVFPSYSGTDLAVAAQIASFQPTGSSAYVDRSREAERRGETSRGKSGGYLSADRISASAAEENATPTPRRIFRVDPASHAVLESGDEILVAHSRYLERIFYVARLTNGEWESYRNKALI
ncbi:MAG: hypothetical protein M3437_13035 [Chloroflexota bacterium]|nr:hypothetical protein [Chloroflexota bacterium]MDQ5864393.1 hypothetical protein [Chloroflexota bacterium]